MADFIGVRAISRSQNVRVNKKKVNRAATTFVDLDDPVARRDLERHLAIGAVIVVEGLRGSADAAVVWTGCEVNEGASAIDMIIRVLAGELQVLETQAYVAVAQQDLTHGAADVTNARIDLISVDYGTGVAAITAGTPAATPVAPAVPAGRVPLAQVNIPAGDTAITNNQITDKRPRA